MNIVQLEAGTSQLEKNDDAIRLKLNLSLKRIFLILFFRIILNKNNEQNSNII